MDCHAYRFLRRHSDSIDLQTTTLTIRLRILGQGRCIIISRVSRHSEIRERKLLAEYQRLVEATRKRFQRNIQYIYYQNSRFLKLVLFNAILALFTYFVMICTIKYLKNVSMCSEHARQQVTTSLLYVDQLVYIGTGLARMSVFCFCFSLCILHIQNSLST